MKDKSYRVSVKSLVSQDKKCVRYAQSNCRERIKSFKKSRVIIEFAFETCHRLQNELKEQTLKTFEDQKKTMFKQRRQKIESPV